MSCSAPSSPSNTRAGPSNDSWSVREAGHLHHRPVGRQRAPQHEDAALGVDGRVERVHDDAVGPGRVDRGQVLGDGPAGDGEAVAVEQPGVEEVLHHDRHAADAVEVGHVELAARLHVGDVRHACRDPVEVVEVERHPRLVGDGHEVEHGVRGAAEGVGDGDGVLERLLRHDLARRDAELEHAAPRPGRRRGRRPRGGGRRRAARPSPAGSCRWPRRSTTSCWR